MKNIVAYIRGGLGDVWPAVSAIKVIAEKENIDKQNIFVFSDSVYYFRDYPQQLTDYSINMIRKLTNNIITIHPLLNNNFWLSKDGISVFDDTTDELSQEEADKYLNEFMFWRPQQLRDMVKSFITTETIFIDALFTECILLWKGDRYERVGNERKVFEFNSLQIEKDIVDTFISNFKKHLLIHVRKKKEGDAHTENDDFYQSIIIWCIKNDIMPMLIGIEGDDYDGVFSDMRGSNVFSFEGMAYLIDKCNVMLGNDSGFSAIKLYQQQKDKLLIMNYPRFERSKWYTNIISSCYKNKETYMNYVDPILDCHLCSNYLLLDAKEDNFNKIIKAIGDYYGKM